MKHTKTIRLIAASLALTTFSISSQAATKWTLGGKAYDVDTVYNAQLGPGITQTNMVLSGSDTKRIYCTTVDLANEYNDMRVLKGGSGHSGLKAISKQAADATKEGLDFIAGTNCDFFSNNEPLGHLVLEGIPYNTSASRERPVWFITDQDKVGVGSLDLTGTATCNGKSQTISGINGARNSGLALFTHHYGDSYSTNGLGGEAKVKLIEGNIGYVSKCKLEVVENGKSISTMKPTTFTLSENEWALSGNSGAPGKFVAGLKKGDIVEIEFKTVLGVEGNVRELVGGYPVILQNGKVLETPHTAGYEHLYNELAPRTAVGYNQDRTKCYMLVLDGGSKYSTGMYSADLAQLMLYLGCYDALNFDGGGSSEIYTKAHGMMNNPRGTNTERAVANSLWAVCTAPTDNTVATIAFETAKAIELPSSVEFTPVIYSYNKYGMLLSTDFKDFTLSCSAEVGTPSADGHSIVTGDGGKGTITATYGECSVSIPVNVAGLNPIIKVDSILIDNFSQYLVPVTTEVQGKEVNVDQSKLQWTSSDNSIATVDNGTIHGIADGIATITASHEGFSHKIIVTVEIPTQHYSPLALASSEWTYQNSGMSTVQATNEGSDLKIDYTIKTARQPNITMRGDMQLASLPDSIRIVATAPEGTISSIQVGLDPRGSSFVSVTKEDISTEKFTVLAALDEAFDVADLTKFPVSLRHIRIYAKGNANASSSITIHSIDAVYKNVELSGVEDITTDDSFDANSPVEYYNLSGIRVDATNLAKGIYIKRQGTRTIKVLVK